MNLKTFYDNYSNIFSLENIFYHPIVYSFFCVFLFEYFIDKKICLSFQMRGKFLIIAYLIEGDKTDISSV